ncbi:MAG: 16S rRNA (cytosine(1402)-N(4))-methyltransferase [Candidatus Pelagibacter sp. TMED166]|nr:MAG: 16S rRNA (cytosine(1402)-N(4))-methyltransferase [Candidatus Pelagibacter sp. TMED166]|tara:strand:+ start:4749 stop:5756 length:1008 start_codon:yes stop_codon:yes gene_type:complete
MSATIISDPKKHYPVLLDQIKSKVPPLSSGTLIDCTFGNGGYTEEFLKNTNLKVIALDRDQETQEIAKKFKEKYKNRFEYYNLCFSELDKLEIKNHKIVGVLFDLGYSQIQINNKYKGLSFNSDGELNMQMGLNKFSAKDAVEKLDQNQLEKIFKFLGEDKDGKKISKQIVKLRNSKKIDTKELVRIVDACKPMKKKIHKATKIFQSLRIFVNKEITELVNGLIKSTEILEKNGFILVVSFHSIEDKIVKYFFNDLSKDQTVSRYLPNKDQKEKIFQLLNKKPIIPSPEEVKKNPASRSSKLRIAVKIKDTKIFKTTIKEKFKYLTDIEDFSENL